MNEGCSNEAEFGKDFLKTKIIIQDLYFIFTFGISFTIDFRLIFLKYYNYSKNYIINKMENSMKNLKPDFLDLLLLQRPGRLMQADGINNVIDHLEGN